MSDRNNDATNNELPRYAQYTDMIMGHVGSTNVDLGWLEDYDLDMIDGIGSFVQYEACKQEIFVKDSPFESVEDLAVYGNGVSISFWDAFSVLRSQCKEPTNLFLILLLLSDLAYKNGARDAFEGRLSTEALRKLAEKRAAADRGRQARKDFFDDIRGC